MDRPRFSREAAIRRLRSLPRLRLGFYPTPVEAAPRLAATLGPRSPRLLVKRDDYTGFALGGNKVRKLEMLLGTEAARGADTLITGGAVGSNHARVAAACAARLGMRCILVLSGETPEPPRGNALLHRLLGAEIVPVPTRDQRAARMDQVAEKVRRAGGRPLLIPIGASTPLGALGYAEAALELDAQLEDSAGRDHTGTPVREGSTAGARPGALWIIVPSSSCGTLAGILLGSRLCKLQDAKIVAVSADEPAPHIVRTTRTLAEAAGQLIGWDEPVPQDAVEASDEFVGPGYGIPTPESRAALELFARTEGILLDPVYTAKAAAALVAWTRAGRFEPHDTVIFWHTGGQPALFA